MGCIVEGCDYWVHVRCTKYKDKLKRKKDIEKLKFLCEEHNVPDEDEGFV